MRDDNLSPRVHLQLYLPFEYQMHSASSAAQRPILPSAFHSAELMNLSFRLPFLLIRI